MIVEKDTESGHLTYEAKVVGQPWEIWERHTWKRVGKPLEEMYGMRQTRIADNRTNAEPIVLGEELVKLLCENWLKDQVTP